MRSARSYLQEWRTARGLALALALGLVVLAGCARKHAQPGSSAAPAPELPPPVGLIAELAVAHPESTWRGLRALGAPASELLPASFPLLAGALLGLPALGASALDQDVPMRGAILLADGKARGILALHALDGKELVASLTTGNSPPFRAERDAETRITFLLPAAPASAQAGVLAVLDSYLLAAAERQTVLDAAPYVVRTLAKRPAPASDLSLLVEQKPLHELLVPALRASWGQYRGTLQRMAEDERKAHADRSADYADPSAVLLGSDAALEGLFALLDGSRRLELTLDVAAERAALTLGLTPDSSGPAHELAQSVTDADARALLSLPDSTLLALGVTRDARGIQAAADSAGDEWVRVLGERLSARDAKLVRETLGDWERGRGASTQYGLLADPALAGFVHSSVADPAALERAGHGFLQLLALPSVRAPLERFVGTPSVASGKPSAGMAGATVHFSAHDKVRPVLESLELRWRIDGATALAAAAPHAEPVLATLASAARGEHALGGVEGLADAVNRLGAQSALFAYLDARALGAEHTAPVLLSLGKREGHLSVYVELSRAALAAIALRAREH